MLLACTHGLSLLVRVPVPQRSAAAAPTSPAAQRQPSHREPGEELTDAEELSPRELIGATDRRKWARMAAAITETGAVKDITAHTVADVLHLSYNRQLSHRAIGRQLEMDHRVVGKIVAASAELLRSGRVSIKKTEPDLAVS